VTLALLIDESADSHALRRLLAAAGHRVRVAGDVGLLGARDEALFAYAQTHRLVVLTRNPNDFRSLAQHIPHHAGVLLIYRENNPARDMTNDDIVRNQ
jgi:predicted nuclease of predicted toxin-antitoxin system